VQRQRRHGGLLGQALALGLQRLQVGLAAAVTLPADEAPGFLGGLRAGWDALLSFLNVLVTALGAMLPWLAVLAPPVILAWVLVRRRRRRPGTTTA
jgi:hypothetical protein